MAYFQVGKAVRGSSQHAANHDGVTYYLVSSEARNAFLAHPKKHIPAYGGWCAFGMSVSDKFPVDPTSFKIVEGHLLLFLKNDDVDARELWEQADERSLIKRAEGHWRRVQG